jgi:AcrR family transcriptional regulator
MVQVPHSITIPMGMAIPASTGIPRGMILDMDQVQAPTHRLSRDERRNQTRDRLIDAAVEVFNRLGYFGASLEAVADAAGYTKGAVYSNFATKADLFRAVMERTQGGRAAASETLLRERSLGDFIDLMGGLLADQAANEASYDLLTVEFWLAAMRDPALRVELADGYRAMRGSLAPVIERGLEADGVRSDFDGSELATLVSAIGTGILLQYYLEPGAVDPELLPRALRALFGYGTERIAGTAHVRSGADQPA